MAILKNNLPIGFFDSGVGGLTVLKEVKRLLPNENFIYFGDTLHVPYGDKTKEQLLEYSKDILTFFEEKKCKAVVMACNTTSSTIYEDIKDKYSFKIYPIVQTVAKVLANTSLDRLGIFATKATISSNAYQNEIAKYNSNMKVFGQHCPEWVKIVENNTSQSKENIEIIKNDLNIMLMNNPQKIVLGCTHYPFLLPVLTKFAPKELFIDPAKYFAQAINTDLIINGLTNDNSSEHTEEFYVSSEPDKFKNSAKMFYEIEQTVNLLNF